MLSKISYLSKAFGLSMFFKAESREVDTLAEDLCFSKNANTTNTINLHFHVGISIGIAQVSQMRSPGCILCIAFYNDSVFVQSICKCKRSLRFLPGIKVIWLFSAKPVR